MTKNDTLDRLYEKFEGKYTKQQLKYAVYHIEQSVAHYIRNPSIGIQAIRFTKNIQLKVSKKKMREYLKEDIPTFKRKEITEFFNINGEEE